MNVKNNSSNKSIAIIKLRNYLVLIAALVVCQYAFAAQQFGGIDVEFYSDLYYTYNMNAPSNLNNAMNGYTADFSENGYYTYNNAHDSITLNNVGFELSKKLNEASVFAQFDFGAQSEIMNGRGEARNVSQLYFDANVFKNWTLRVGKMFGHVGYETPMANDNLNYSRSLIYTFGTPTWLVGAALMSPQDSAISTNFYVYNGIPSKEGSFLAEPHNNQYSLKDNNHSKTLGLRVVFKPPMNEAMTLTYNGMIGAEKDDNNKDQSIYHDFIAEVRFSDKFNFATEVLVASQENDSNSVSVTGGNQKSKWNGIAVYFNYDITDSLSISPRYEFYHADEIRGQLGLGGASSPAGTTDETVNAATLTVTHEANKFITAKYEARIDTTDNDDAYNNGYNNRTDSQTTFTAAMLMNW